jgi:hypothetical protein
VNEAEITPSHSPTDVALTAGSTDNGTSNIQREASVIEKMNLQLPAPREIEGVRLDEGTILALFEQ